MLHKLPETLPYCVWIPSAHSVTGQIVPLMWIPVLLLMSVSSLTLVLCTHIFLLRMILGELVIQQALWGRSWAQTPNLNGAQLMTTRPDMVTTLDIECSSSGWQSTTMSWDVGQRKDDLLNKGTSPLLIDLEVMVIKNCENTLLFSATDILKEANNQQAGDDTFAPNHWALLAPALP